LIVLNATGNPINATGNSITYGNQCFIAPIRSAYQTNTVYYNNITNELTYSTSAGVDKTNIVNMTNDTTAIYRLQPRNYTYIPDGTENCAGFIADEVCEIDRELAIINEEGNPQNINWEHMITYLVSELQKQNKTIQELTSRITVL
jgi:hypothetical protein